jgi:hypothetical protein
VLAVLKRLVQVAQPKVALRPKSPRLAPSAGCPLPIEGRKQTNGWSFDFFDEGKMTYVAAHIDSLMQCTRSFLQL